MGKKTKSNVSRSRGVVVMGLFVLAACAGKNLNDVGNVDGNGGTADGGGTGGGNDAGKGGTTAAGKGGTSGAGKGGTSTVGHAGTTPIEAGAGPIGFGGSGEPRPPIGEVAGTGGALHGATVCDGCELIAQTPDIRGVWATSDAVYWIEYGGFDALGNYLDNGRLMSLAVDADVPTVVAPGLQGPLQVRVTDDYAYFILDRSSSLDGPTQLARVGLDGGSVELLQTFATWFKSPGGTFPFSGWDWFRRYFAVSGGAVFWYNGYHNTIFRLAENSAGPPEEFQITGDLAMLLADDSFLYLQDAHGISALPSAGGAAATPLWTSENSGTFWSLSLVGNAFYALEADDKVYLSRLPKAGGGFKRLTSVFSYSGTRFSTDGSSFVGDFGLLPAPGSNAGGAIVEGKIADVETTHTLAIGPAYEYQYYVPWRSWDATPTTVYIGFYDELYRVARQF